MVIEDPYIRAQHQVGNFVRLCELLVTVPGLKEITLVTTVDDEDPTRQKERLEELKQSLLELDIALNLTFNAKLHDREIRLSSGWIVKIGRGLDFYQRPESWFHVGASDLALRKCLETKVDIFKA